MGAASRYAYRSRIYRRNITNVTNNNMNRRIKLCKPDAVTEKAFDCLADYVTRFRGGGHFSWSYNNRAVARIFFSTEEKKTKGRSSGSAGPTVGMGSWGGAPSPLPPRIHPQLGVLGERCKLPQRGLGRSYGRQTVFTCFRCSEWPHQVV